MNKQVPNFIIEIYEMISRVFPDGISEESYWVLLYLLYDYLADENLALVMSYLVEKEMGTIENDIYKVCQMQFDDKLVHDVKSRLDAQGFKVKGYRRIL